MADQFEKASPLVVEMAKEFISMLQRGAPNWQKGYWRFDSEESRFGSNASYASSDGVFLIGAVREGRFYESMNTLGRRLWESEADMNRRFRVCLLVVSSSFDYKFMFEPEDPLKWRITKLDGASGIPVGL